MTLWITYVAFCAFANETAPSLIAPSDLASTAPTVASSAQGDYAQLVDRWVKGMQEHKAGLEKDPKNSAMLQKYTDIIQEGQLLSKKLEEEKNHAAEGRYQATVARWKQYEVVCRKTVPEQSDYLSKVAAYQASLEAQLGKPSSSKEDQRVERTKNYSEMMAAYGKQLNPNSPLRNVIETLTLSAEELHKIAIRLRDEQDPLEKSKIKSQYESKRALFKQEHKRYTQKHIEELQKKSEASQRRSSEGGLAKAASAPVAAAPTPTEVLRNARSAPVSQRVVTKEISQTITSAPSQPKVNKEAGSHATPGSNSKKLTLGTAANSNSASSADSFYTAASKSRNTNSQAGTSTKSSRNSAGTTHSAGSQAIHANKSPSMAGPAQPASTFDPGLVSSHSRAGDHKKDAPQLNTLPKAATH